MRLKRLTSYLLQHRWQTVLLTFLITFVPFIGTLSILIAALGTLVEGLIFGTLLTLAATLPYIISFYASSLQSGVPIVIWVAVSVAVLSNLVTYIFAVMLNKQANWSVILQIAALLGVLVVSVIHLIYPDVADWWAAQLQASLNHAQAKGMKMLSVVPRSSK